MTKRGTMANLFEQAALLTLISRSDQEWYKTATVVEETGSALRSCTPAMHPSMTQTPSVQRSTATRSESRSGLSKGCVY